MLISLFLPPLAMFMENRILSLMKILCQIHLIHMQRVKFWLRIFKKLSYENGLNCICLRLATLYGYSKVLDLTWLLTNLLKNALERKPLTIYGDGKNWRPFLHVKNAAKAFVLALNYNTKFDIFNVGSNEENYRIIWLES